MTIIQRTEERHRVVWTAGRVLKEDGSEIQILTSPREKRHPIMQRLRKLLKALADEGILKKRGTQFNFGTMNEIGYDYLHNSESGNRKCRTRLDEKA